MFNVFTKDFFLEIVFVIESDLIQYMENILEKKERSENKIYSSIKEFFLEEIYLSPWPKKEKQTESC